MRGALGPVERSGRAPAPSTVETISGRDRIARVLGALSAANAAGRLRSLAAPEVRPIQVESLELVAGEPGGMRLSLAGPAPPPGLAQAAFGHFNSVFSFLVDPSDGAQPASGARAVQLPLPERLVRVRSRRHRRGRAPVDARVNFRHPLRPDRVVHGALLDVGPEGLSFLFSEHAAPELLPGLALLDLSVLWPGLDPLSLAGEVRHVRRGEVGGRGAVCGMRIVPTSPPARAAWLEALAQAFYPHTQLFAPGMDAAGAPESQVDDLWEVYRRSGYFELSGKNAEAFERHKTAFATASRRLAAAPEIGCHVVWPSARGVEAAYTMVKPYGRTWLDCQLARRQDGEPSAPTREILREVVLRSYEYPARDPEFEWFLTWVQASARFSRLLLHDLVQRFRQDEARAAIVRFRALEGSCGPRVAPRAPGLSVGAPQAGDVDALLATIRSTRPRPYVEAHDLVAGRFNLESTTAAWRDAGLERERQVLVARRGGEAVAAAVLESGEPGLHLFGLLDVVRLWPLPSGQDRSAFPQLLEAARRWYGARQRDRFVYFCEDADPRHALDLGFTDLGEADLTVLSADLMPDQLEHAWEITARRPRLDADADPDGGHVAAAVDVQSGRCCTDGERCTNQGER